STTRSGTASSCCSARAGTSGSRVSPMMFTKRLRDGVRRGEITCSVRIWMRPHVKVGGRYPMEEGEIEGDSVLPIQLDDITPALARASGFKSVPDLLKVAKHGRGESVYLVGFHYVPPAGARASRPHAERTATPRRSGTRRRSAPSRS